MRDNPATADTQRWIALAVFATAMAFAEAAVVAYLRALFQVTDPYQPPPMPVSAWFIHTEIVREAATLIMLGAVGWLVGRTWQARLGGFLLIFGVWDILYYVFLVPLTGWPRSLLDWDILFLIPLPWWGPVLAPVSIAVLMVLSGALLLRGEGHPPWPAKGAWGASLVGALIALYVFMADAIRVAGDGIEAIQKMRPASFNWALFAVAWVLMATPVLALSRRSVRRETQER